MNTLLRTIQYYTRFLCLTASILIAAFLSSCHEDSEPAFEEEHTVQMSFAAAPPSYTDDTIAGATRAATSDWPDGARLYLEFTGSDATGTATYDASSQAWMLTFSGNLSADTDATCEVWYFENALSSTADEATLSPHTATYHTAAATYLYHNNHFYLRGSLKPTEVRIRFRGIAGTVMTLTEWPHYGTFTRSTSATKDASLGTSLTLTVGSDGYTPYFYGHYGTNDNEILLHVDLAGTPFYRLLFDTDVQHGRSYSIDVPTESLVEQDKWSHSLSKYRRTFTVTGNGKTVTFTMKKVKKGSFQMGSTSGYSSETPVHSVTLTKDYYIGETEVTQALWYAVMGYSPTSGGSQWSSTYGLGDERPAYYISYEDCQSFLTALNSKLASQLSSGEQFRFPTEAEWEFAAKGGNKSNGYTYSGSNTIVDVAWCYYNSYALGSSNANYGTHVVKTKSPNELGLYDMSGNVNEWCYDWYDSYSSSAQTDPTGPTSGSYRVIRGGSWGIDATGGRVTNRDGDSPTLHGSHIGFRLCLGAPIGQ